MQVPDVQQRRSTCTEELRGLHRIPTQPPVSGNPCAEPGGRRAPAANASGPTARARKSSRSCSSNSSKSTRHSPGRLDIAAPERSTSRSLGMDEPHRCLTEQARTSRRRQHSLRLRVSLLPRLQKSNEPERMNMRQISKRRARCLGAAQPNQTDRMLPRRALPRERTTTRMEAAGADKTVHHPHARRESLPSSAADG
jgi:hypothetical protein